MPDHLKTREERMRRLLARGGFRLRKTPARSHLRYYGAGYMIINSRNCIQLGSDYDATIEEVEYWAPRLVSEGA